jgi:hypothetical protein
MNLRSLSLTTLFAATLVAASAHAHDPALHELPAPKAKPTTCDELADTKRYAIELADKTLKTTCEAEVKAAQKQKDEKAKSDEGDE